MPKQEMAVLNQTRRMHWAADAVMRDLVNALLQENWRGMAENGRVTERLEVGEWEAAFELAEGERYFHLDLGAGRAILFRIRTEQFLQPYKISRLPVLLVPEPQPLGAGELIRLLADDAPNLEGFVEDLQVAVEQSALSLAAGAEWQDGGHSEFLRWERFSALRDRPFHPTSRAKQGWTREEYLRYSPEFGEELALDWVAVRREYITQGERAGEIAPFILDEKELLRLGEAMEAAGVSADTHVAMPVHPWQMEHALPDVYAEEIARGIVVPLPVSAGRFAATSSLRALSPLPEGRFHVKVPIGIYSLAALRILPLRYLQNAERAQGVLRQVIQSDPLLQDRLRLCGEERWWGFDDPEADSFADKPGHLACLIREYPREWMEDESMQLIAMSTLAVVDLQGRVPALERLLSQCGPLESASATEIGFSHPLGNTTKVQEGASASENGLSQHLSEATESQEGASASEIGLNHLLADAIESQEGAMVAEHVATPRSRTVIELFAEIAGRFVEMCLTCFRYGLMPEVHGQNVMVALREGRVAGLLLRDHDTVRLHLPWLEREGFSDPGYVVKPGTPNSLINPTPEKLLSYFQTLGLQVNLYAIADAVSRAYSIEERVLWRVIREAVERCLSEGEFPADVRDVIAGQLLLSETWPTRTLIGPLLKRVGSGGGSMPADTGETANPLLRCLS